MKFKDLTKALEPYYGVELGNDIGLIKDIVEQYGDKGTDDIDYNHPNFEQYKANTSKQYLAVCFLHGAAADRAKCTFVTDLEENYTKGTNHIPPTVVAAYRLLDRIKLQEEHRNVTNVRNCKHYSYSTHSSSSIWVIG
jgi:hypothetical protein